MATVLRHVLTPLMFGMVAGITAAVPAALALSGQPFYLQLTDPLAYVGALAIFAVAGFTAAIAPAAKALRGNPVEALWHP
jgi:hypothetical protein